MAMSMRRSNDFSEEIKWMKWIFDPDNSNNYHDNQDIVKDSSPIKVLCIKIPTMLERTSWILEQLA
jgi:hypothetical protein